VADYVWQIPESVDLQLGAGKVERYVRASEAAKVREHLVLEGHQSAAKVFVLTNKVEKLERNIELICSLRDQRIEELNGVANKHAREADLKDAAIASGAERIKQLEDKMAELKAAGIWGGVGRAGCFVTLHPKRVTVIGEQDRISFYVKDPGRVEMDF
jgi:hypothetical protein